MSYTHGLFAQILPYIREKFLFNPQNRIKVNSFPISKGILTTRLYFTDKLLLLSEMNTQLKAIGVSRRICQFSNVLISVHVLYRFSDNSI